MNLFDKINPANLSDEIEALNHDARLAEDELKNDVTIDEMLCHVCENAPVKTEGELCQNCRYYECDESHLEKRKND